MITQETFDKFMKEETFACKNPVLLKAIKKEDDASCLIQDGEGAEVLGKCLQGLMKMRKEDELSGQTFLEAKQAVQDFGEKGLSDTLAGVGDMQDGIYNTLATTWEKGEQIFNLAFSKGHLDSSYGGTAWMARFSHDYQGFCRAINQKYVKSSSRIMPKTR